MKKLVTISPIFDPANRTLDFSTYPEFEFKRVYAVINVTRNTPIYIPGATGYGINAAASSINPNLVTLSFDTTSHSATDQLNVYYETPHDSYDSTDPIQDSLRAIHETLHFMLVEMKVQTILMSEGFYGRLTREDSDNIRFEVSQETDSEQGV
jgi:hypothetical protein